uniref:Ig-like domain-containing protein n=1 Tax=Paramormyrops kingsleyae TaxID=1676925 RepID=A0A3B3QN28_9TELE
MVALLLILCLLHHLPAVFGANLYACPGETVTLPCDGPADKDTNVVDMLWKFGSMTICSFKNGISKFEHRDFVNRTQLGSIRQSNFSLVINRVIVQDHGGYKCLINDKVIQRNNLFVRVPDENSPGEFILCLINMLLPQSESYIL